jgi:hemerythrin-like domain-containing protein
MTSDVVGELYQEHDRLRFLLQRIERAAEASDVAALADALAAGRAALGTELDEHIATEERAVFTTVRDELGEGLVAPFEEEHREIEALRDLVLGWSGASDPPYEQSLELCDRILQHQQREDLMLFPIVRGILSSRHP